MTKTEFLEKLKEELWSEADMQTVRENVEYYDGYIREEVAKGRSESEVLDELGDPWVIAKTILDAQGQNGQGERVYEESQEKYSGYSRNTSGGGNTPFWALDTWWKKLVLILGIVGVISLVISVVSGIVNLVAPVLVPVLVVVLIVKLVKRR